MASSLAELLAEEGFSRGKPGMKARASFHAEAGSRARVGDQRRTESPLGPPGCRRKNERSRPDVSRYILKGELPRSDSGSSRRPRDDLVRRTKIDSRSKRETWQKPGRRGSDDTQEDEALSDDSMEGLKGNEIVEVGVEKDEKFKDIYSDKAYNSERSERSSKENGEMNKRYGANLDEDLLKYTVLSNNSRKSLKKPQTSYESSVRGSKNAKNVYDVHRPKLQNSSPAVSELALDEVAVKAVISILNGYMKRFLVDEEFRSKLHHDSFSLLGFDETAEDDSIDSKVITNLEQAIDIVEKAVEEAASAKDLKKASLQLSVITGLKSNDLKDGYTSGIPNCRLSACAHLYLSVIYKLQKKDRISAKHLLQAFCDAPFWARTLLLPELWDYLFFPQLSHLKVWCDQEADSLPNTPSKIRKLRLLEKVYNEILDSGTYQFAFYYKDWLTEGVEAPSVPSIHIPSLLVRGVQQWGSQDSFSGQGSPSGPLSPQPMVSKKLYDAVIGISSKPGVYEVEDDLRTNEFENGANSSYISAADVEQEQALTDSSEFVKYLVEDMHNNASSSREDNILTSPRDDGLLLPSKEDWKLVKVSSSPDRDLKEVTDHIQQDFADRETVSASSHTKDNELTLRSLAKSVFQIHKTRDPVDLKVFSSKPFKTRTSCEDFDEESLFANAPQDFICPLTGELFDDPVTLETGQTFERESIREWFNKGNRTCPVTGNSLEFISIPITNYILKRLINSWKSQYCSQLIAFASQMIQDSQADDLRKNDGTTLRVLEMIFTSFRGEERLAYAKQLIALGGLEFLIRMFKFGNFEEKTRVVPLLSTSIEVEAGCRGHIARRIDKHGLLELIRSKQSNSRRNAIFLLIELVCLSRRTDVALFLSGLQNEEIVNVMHNLLVYLQTSPLEQRPLVSVLLLKLDLLVAPQKYSIHREVAVDSISEALECSLSDEKVRENSCRALLILGGRFSSSGKLLTERWILKQAGLTYDCEVSSKEDDLLFQSSEEDEEAYQDKLRRLSASLLGSGKRSLLETISECLSSGNLEIVRVCLTTVAWLSCALSSPPDADSNFQLSAFSVLIPGLKDSLENGERIELKVLASISLVNFSKVPECRVLLKAIAEEIAVPLRRLSEVTWTAKQLYSTLFGE